ncbi:MAG: diguanylate cyclase [Deltaproteobacteria bacterium]|nr:diguanylate cyclase [Deltaproteobacteria bacterium]
MTRKAGIVPTQRTILLVDDSPDYTEASRRLLEREGHTVFCTGDGAEAIEVLRSHEIDLVLLDYYMPGLTGEETVARLREFNPHVQVILQTAYAGEKPPREMLRRLDIQGYHDKSEGPEKMLLWVDVGLKAAFAVQLLHKSRKGLRYLLDIAPDLHKFQPLDDLLQGVLWQVAGLLGVTSSFIAEVPPSPAATGAPAAQGFVAIVEGEAELVVRASTGRFTTRSRVEHCLPSPSLEAVRRAMSEGRILVEESSTIVPLRAGETTIGVIFLDQPIVLDQHVELLGIFANQAALAVQNARLYALATMDGLTGVYVRHFLEQSLVRDLRLAFRARLPLALLVVDLDDLKRINDAAGHGAGDAALRRTGRVLREAIRGSDMAGRFGGDEFVLVLGQTDLDGAELVAGRILQLVGQSSVTGPLGEIPLRCSMGGTVVRPHEFALDTLPRPLPHQYFHRTSRRLLASADEALYRAKKAGGHRYCAGQMVDWAPLSEEGPTGGPTGA